ncbi:unnamed protein product [Cladocopium goreaui]|uniref:Extended synaptotagmin-3 n=1 Tax=Cladocopium goreaui TaxID=2562237 RepID=A0A9P1GHY8_9DINO|nr:unnamed protein product [Cladocopium goreaui]
MSMRVASNSITGSLQNMSGSEVNEDHRLLQHPKFKKCTKACDKKDLDCVKHTNSVDRSNFSRGDDLPDTCADNASRWPKWEDATFDFVIDDPNLQNLHLGVHDNDTGAFSWKKAEIMRCSEKKLTALLEGQNLIEALPEIWLPLHSGLGNLVPSGSVKDGEMSLETSRCGSTDSADYHDALDALDATPAAPAGAGRGFGGLGARLGQLVSR